MREHDVRHLPVLRDGDLVGVLSDREVQALEVLPGSRHLTVEEAMVPDVYVTSEHAPLETVASEMVRRHVGSAVVVAGADGSKVLGVFTAVEALRALSDALRRPAVAASGSTDA
jgi:acetoin utilization protein AcuB